MDALPTCCICCSELGTYGGPVALACGHNGCADCLAGVQRRSASATTALCPLCRHAFDASSPLAVNRELQALLALAKALATVERPGGWREVAVTVDAGSNAEDGPPHPTAPPLPAADPTSELAPPLRLGACHLPFPAPGGASHALQPPLWPPEGGSVHALQPPLWLPDSAAAQCMAEGCGRRFSLASRRHHCRLCGLLFCGADTRDRMMLPPRFAQRAPQRVCRHCAARLAPLQAYLAGTLSRASQPAVHDAPDAASWRALVNLPYGRTMEAEVFKATNILLEFARLARGGGGSGGGGGEGAIPCRVLEGCAGVAALSVLRVGAGWSCSAGTGVIVSRRRGGWSAPCALVLVAGGMGWQLGAHLVHLVVVLRDTAAVRAFCGSSLGVGASFGASAGLLGREVAAGVRVSTSGGGSCLTYSTARGAFAGVALDGVLMRSRDGINGRFYGGQRVPARTLLLSDRGPRPPAACAALYRSLDELVACAC